MHFLVVAIFNEAAISRSQSHDKIDKSKQQKLGDESFSMFPCFDACLIPLSSLIENHFTTCNDDQEKLQTFCQDCRISRQQVDDY